MNDIESEQCLDALNLAYVAFTRAKDELYVYISAKPADKGIGKAITEIKSAEDLKLPGLIMADEGEFDEFEEGGEAGDDDDIEAKLLFSFGARPDRDYVLKRNEKENSDKPKEEEMVLESYRVNINLPEIKYAPEEESPFSGDNEAETNKRLDKITREALKSWYQATILMTASVASCCVRRYAGSSRQTSDSASKSYAQRAAFKQICRRMVWSG